MTPTIAPPTPHHARLNALVGRWAGPTTTCFEPTSAPLSSQTTARFTWVAAGHYLLQEYESTCNGDTANGILLVGFDEPKGKLTAAWGDSFHAGTGLMISEGVPTDGALLDVLTHYGVGGGEPWGWRTVIDMTGPDEARIRWYNVMPGCEPYVAVETCLKRQP